MALPVQFTSAGLTDVGIVRSGNEDSYLIVDERAVFIVADGMGGHAAGEVASEMAVRIIAEELGDIRGVGEEPAAARMREAIRQANASIFERTLTEHDKRGMGTTATALVLNGQRYLIGQVGDSRAYLLRDSELTQLTKDHSYVQEQVDAGYLSPEEARTHPYSNVITRCVGANNDVAPDTYVGSLRAGDIFVLASDGLTGMVDDPDLHNMLLSSRNPEALAQALINEANHRGGLDNITVIAVRIDGVETVRDDRPTLETGV
ncbi:MAG TPA: Stp1/IreP family PP2C-type Ser/Thr phosphatase [Gemmatimonadales bacterium]